MHEGKSTNGTSVERPLSPWWRRGALIVMAAGFSVLAFITVLTYRNAPPIPGTVADQTGRVLFTDADVTQGQEVFFKYGLMEHGTLWGHGAYLGPDYTAAYLHREAEITRDYLARAEFGVPFADLGVAEQEQVQSRVKDILKENRYDRAADVLTFTPPEVESFTLQQREWADAFTAGLPGLSRDFIRHPDEMKALTVYFAWATWATRADRPGHDYSYTNNWPYEPIAGNTPPTQAFLWSALSLVFLLGGLGIVLFAFGRFNFLGWRGEPGPRLEPVTAPERTLTPSQRVTALFFLVVAALFVLQALAGGALAHYRVEPTGFYGVDLARGFPYNLLRTWHLQLAVFWIATAWVGGGLFLGPLLGGEEPKGQKWGALVLLGALAVVVFGSLAGEFAGIRDMLGNAWFWLGHQGSEYLDLGKAWQIMLAVGLVFWLFLVYRALKPAFRRPAIRELSGLFLLAAAGIVIFYLPAFLYTARTNFAIIDNWRFWIIHLWVEGFFELFATVVVALMFSYMGLVTVKTAVRVVYLDAILYLMGGIIGTSHHWYFTGQLPITMALGGMFSALEVVPLTLLTLDAWDFIRLQKGDWAAGQKWAIYFLMAVGVWNFVGAGVLGFLINLPIVSYFEMGTTLTPNHGHAAMFGVFGMLGLAVLTFCLRAMLSERAWAGVEKYFKVGFWGVNVGLALMIILNLFPAGVAQLYDVLQHGYAHARSTDYTMHGFYHLSEWIRIVGDSTFLLLGSIPIAIGTVLAVVRIGRAKRAE
jgi:nitric oxide reductase subunit B